MSHSTDADRSPIQALLEAYAFALDDGDWDAVRAVFTADAHLDYSASGGPVGSPDEVVPWIRDALALFDAGQHHLTNCQIEIEGDEATARTYLWNPLRRDGEGRTHVLLVSGEYRDRLRRTGDGWRIVERVEHSMMIAPLPAYGG